MKVFILFFFLLKIVLVAQIQADFTFPPPDSLSKLNTISVWATQYYIHQFNSGGTIPLLEMDGKSINLYADTCNFCKAALEGTAWVKDSTGNVVILNFAGRSEKSQVDCRKCSTFSTSKLAVEDWGKTRWMKSTGFGNGVKNYKLVPYRTIAVDKDLIPYGTVLYIPAARGASIELPNGEVVKHDGYFFAGDTGSAIKGNHLDIFTGIFSVNPFPDFITSRPSGLTEAFVVNDQKVIQAIRLEHRAN